MLTKKLKMSDNGKTIEERLEEIRAIIRSADENAQTVEVKVKQVENEVKKS